MKVEDNFPLPDGFNTNKDAAFGGEVTFNGNVTFNGETSGIGGLGGGVVDVNLVSFIAGEDEQRDVMKVETQNGYTYISTSGNHLVKTGSGYLSHIIVTGGSAGTIAVYDSTTAPGTVIASFDSTNAIATYTFDALFSEGLVITTSANTKLTVLSS